MALTLGTVFSRGVGILYLWVFPASEYPGWPHFMMLSFYLFIVIGIAMVLVSLFDKSPQTDNMHIEGLNEKPSRLVVGLWVALIVVMIGLYLFFNGH